MINTLFVVAITGSAALAVHSLLRQHRLHGLLALVGLGLLTSILLSSGLVALPWAAAATPRGGGGQRTTLFWLYLSMLAGMFSHFLYLRFERPARRRRKFDLGNFLAPIFVSPIVFLPLASLVESADPASASGSRLMLFLVAYENGFFWREFFANRSRAIEQGEGT